MGSAGDELKKDFRNIFKHSKKMINGIFRGRRSNNNCNTERRTGSCQRPMSGMYGGGGFRPPFFPFKCPFRSPWLVLFYPKLIVAGLILIALLLCGVGLYGVIIVILLMIIFLLI